MYFVKPIYRQVWYGTMFAVFSYLLMQKFLLYYPSVEWGEGVQQVGGLGGRSGTH